MYMGHRSALNITFIGHFSSVAAFACNFLVSAVDISQSFAEWEPQIQTVVSTTSERIIRICYGIYIGPYIQIQTFDIVRSAVGTVELTYGTMIFLKLFFHMNSPKHH
ncbi:hypothetical protein B0H13DRAFT_2305656 [Mycena leptocephala]|nr:hypothetical protein B0H13DRAFT_2305656 [Mycena leptocephala]